MAAQLGAVIGYGAPAMTEFCLLLDLPLGVGAIVVALVS
jgi:hypothetical protein